MKRVVAFVAISAFVAFSSCSKEKVDGHGPIISEIRSVTGFTAVSATGSTTVKISQGALFKVEVKGYNNLLPYFETKLVNNTLQLGYKNGVNVKNDNTEVYITMPALTGLALAGSGDISTSGAFNGNVDFNAAITGSGDIQFSSGTTQHFSSTIQGSGNIYAINMVADKAEADIAGSGNAEITANSQLKVKINGSGNVYYRGSPVITTQVSGSGAVIPR